MPVTGRFANKPLRGQSIREAKLFVTLHIKLTQLSYILINVLRPTRPSPRVRTGRANCCICESSGNKNAS